MIAASHSPFRIALKAQSRAYIELLQAVSNINDGPINPRANEILFARNERLQLLEGTFGTWY